MKPKSLSGNLVKDVFRLQASRLSVKMGGIFYKTTQISGVKMEVKMGVKVGVKMDNRFCNMRNFRPARSA